MSEQWSSDALEGIEPEVLLAGVSTIFQSLGRALLCLDRSFEVLHTAPGVDDLLGPGTRARIQGRPVSELLGAELFGPGGVLRRPLEAGERREGWGATAKLADGKPRFLSVTAAPLRHDPGSPCDPRVAYLVVLRPAEDAPTHTSDTVLFANMVARSQKMKRIFELIENLHASDATVLVSGESGTGKELVARAIHLHSPRRGAPFVAVNCGALPAELLESELFGHVRGAFTGAVRDRSGRFELAAGGTLFLDEIADVPLPLQVKLLRVLQERTFERVGESRSRSAEARIIAAANVDLRQAVTKGLFREDLFYRLRVVPIEIPPLRERREDIEPLCRHLLAKIADRHGRSLVLAPDALRALHAHDWPGNVRELENVLEFAVAVAQGQTLHASDFPDDLQSASPALPAGGSELEAEREPAERRDAGTKASAEKRRLRAALDAHQWRRAAAAEALGMSRTTLWRKMREHGLLD